MHSRKWRLAGLGLVVLAAVTTGAVVQAAPGRALTAGEARSLAQRPLVAAAEVLRAEVSGLPGFAGITLESQVVLWWHGAAPSEVTAVLARARRLAPVRVAAAAHSKAQLDEAAVRLRAWLAANPDSGGYAVKSPGDGSGLVLAARPDAAMRGAAAVADVGVAVRVVHEEPMARVSRNNDSAPWSGGARTWNRNANTICTSGFGVRNGANNQFVLTAEHCGKPGNRIDDGGGEFIGNVGPAHDDHDIALIPTSRASNRMYVGGRDSNTTEQVTGWGHVFTGQYLCQSGVTSAEATGGPVCDLKVLFFWQDPEDLVEVEQQQGQPGARGGDSGGSVYSRVAGGVQANGTVTRAAGPRMGFQDFATASRDFGVYIP